MYVVSWCSSIEFVMSCLLNVIDLKNVMVGNRYYRNRMIRLSFATNQSVPVFVRWVRFILFAQM